MSRNVSLTFRGLTFTGDGQSTYHLEKLTGWLGWPGSASFQSGPSAFGHGNEPSPGVLGSRLPDAEGWLLGDEDTIDQLIQDVNDVMVPASSLDADTEPLTVTMAGQTATADAQLIAFDWDTSTAWGSGVVKWVASFRCPDPFKYSDWISTTVTLVVPAGGDTLPQTLGFVMDDQPLGGRASIFNPGTNVEGSPSRFTLVGGQTGTPGVQVIQPSGRIVTVTYPLTLLADRGDGLPDTLVIDTARGGAYLNGEYRPPNPGPDVVADLRLPPGVSVVQALGTAGSGTPTMQVEVRPAKS